LSVQFSSTLHSLHHGSEVGSDHHNYHLHRYAGRHLQLCVAERRERRRALGEADRLRTSDLPDF
ncbi:hypothetical protein EXIGLDRAFT_841345, partial [Exidia glandulosa HHB12029]